MRRWFLSVVGGLLVLSTSAQAQLPVLDPQQFVWSTVDLMLPVNTPVALADGNTLGQLLGEAEQAFVLRPGAGVDVLACPDPLVQTFHGLNDHGHIVGSCLVGSLEQAVVLPSSQGTVGVAVSPPGATATLGLGISNWGHIVGAFFDAAGGLHGFWSVGLATPDGQPSAQLDATFPGQEVLATALLGLNEAGAAVGYYEEHRPGATPAFVTHGLFWGFGAPWQWDAPGAVQTWLWDIDATFAVVGLAEYPEGYQSVYRDPVTGEWFAIVHPNPAVLFTDVAGITSAGALVGRVFFPDPATPHTVLARGFVATPKPVGLTGEAAPLAAVQTRQALSVVPDARTAGPPLRITTTGCDGNGSVVPLKMQALLGCR